MASFADGPEYAGEVVTNLVCTHAADEGEPAGNEVGVQCVAQRDDLVGRHRRAYLAADRVVDAAEELDVGTVETTSALADPNHVSRAVVPIAGEGVLASEGFLIAQNQCLVAGVDVDFVD